MKPHRPFHFLFITTVVVIIDQITKMIVRAKMPLYHSISVIGDFFRLTHVENPGAAFSIGFGSDVFNRVFFSTVTVLLMLVILYMFKHSKSLWEKISYSLVLGGAIGNLLDRLIFGKVTDFFDFRFFTINIFNFYMDRWPVFNIADSSVCIAIILLLYYTIFIEYKRR